MNNKEVHHLPSAVYNYNSIPYIYLYTIYDVLNMKNWIDLLLFHSATHSTVSVSFISESGDQNIDQEQQLRGFQLINSKTSLREMVVFQLVYFIVLIH